VIRIEILEDDCFSEVSRLERGPTPVDFLKFEAVLDRQFNATQAAVHVITRSLKTSGKQKSNSDNNSWEGEISYGGLAAGALHNPVDYAEYELERDGSHNFLAPAERLSPAYVTAINEFLRG
jgi:hypothetical protein